MFVCVCVCEDVHGVCVLIECVKCVCVCAYVCVCVCAHAAAGTAALEEGWKRKRWNIGYIAPSVINRNVSSC